ncbi:hypothetical protein EI555_013354, partial [Monodon monoceros]
SSAQASQLVFGQVKLGCHTESLLPTATSHKGTESFLVGTSVGKHEPCWHTQVLLQQVFPGAQFLTELAPLCKIYCSDGEEYTISSCVRGRLMEVNENILHKPSSLQEKVKGSGE